MKQLIFSTGNSMKFELGRDTAAHYDIELIQKVMDVVEIQSEDPEAVAVAKAKAAYEMCGQPVVISDDSWSFSGLNGFPGVYMHSMNHWLTAEDFLNLTRLLMNRKATLTQCLVYCDGAGTKLFKSETHGEILKEARGNSVHPNHMIITLDGDDGRSIAEAYDAAEDKSDRKAAVVWRDFCDWYSAKTD